MKTNFIFLTLLLLVVGSDAIYAQYAGGSGRGDHMAVLTGIEEPDSDPSDHTFVANIDGVNYLIEVFSTPGSYQWSPPEDVSELDYLIVAGGGGGASRHGGGGGAGGVVTSFLDGIPFSVNPSETYIIVVGAGGLGSHSSNSANGNQGQNSHAFGFTAIGGGAGNGGANLNNMDGGSGGGRRGNQTGVGGTAVEGQGNHGGGSDSQLGGGGGGGFVEPGQDGQSPSYRPGNGGAGGDLSSFVGTTVGDNGFFAGGGGAGGGGGGGFDFFPGGDGGIGGGGRGGDSGAESGQDAMPNTGGGGGGGGFTGNDVNAPGGAGGSGVVIVRYQITLTTTLPGPNEGWRILGAPVSGATYGDLLSGLWTQGFPGASSEDGSPNVYWYNQATREFTAPAASSNIIGSSSDDGFNNAGRGFVAYVYEDDFNDGTSTEWPKTISVKGVPHAGEMAVTYTRTELPDDTMQGWHFASNPYSFPINWTSLVADNALEDMISVIFVYDANTNESAGGYRIHYGFDVPILPETVAHDGIIAPFQGFWVRTAGTAPEGSITFRESYETTGGTLFDAPEPPPLLAFSVEGESLEASAVLLIDGGDEVSTSKPVPFSTETIRFGFMRESNLQPDVFRTMEALPGDERIIPLDFAALNTGVYMLKLNGSGLPEMESTVTLRDHLTDAEHHLTPENPYTFEYVAHQKLGSNKKGFNPKTALTDSKSMLLESEHRFELQIQFGNATTTEPISELPTVFAMHQNYPNPFNPTTQINYDLPEAADVRLDVFNVMGQRVATLVNDHQNAGTHNLRFDASRLASGVYIYRLQAGGKTFTKKMTLIK